MRRNYTRLAVQRHVNRSRVPKDQFSKDAWIAVIGGPLLFFAVLFGALYLLRDQWGPVVIENIEVPYRETELVEPEYPPPRPEAMEYRNYWPGHYEE